MAHFHITPGTPSLSLSDSRQGQFSFTVTNNLGRAVRIQASVRPEGSAEAKWMSIEGAAERDLSPTETQTFIVQVQAPKDAPAGEQRFRLLVASIAHPDDEYDTSPPVAFTVPAAQPGSFPWWIVAAAAGVLVIAGGGFLVFRALRVPGLSEPCPDAKCQKGYVCSAQDAGSICFADVGTDCQAPGECATAVCEGRRDGGAGNVCGPACVAENDHDFCRRLGKQCGSAAGTDHCGRNKTVAECGRCASPMTCTSGVCQAPAPGVNCASSTDCASNETCVGVKPGVKACLLKGGQPCKDDLACASWCIERKRQCAPENGACTVAADCPSLDFSCSNGFCKVQLHKRCEQHADCVTNNCDRNVCQECTRLCPTGQYCEGNQCVRAISVMPRLDWGRIQALRTPLQVVPLQVAPRPVAPLQVAPRTAITPLHR